MKRVSILVFAFLTVALISTLALRSLWFEPVTRTMSFSEVRVGRAQTEDGVYFPFSDYRSSHGRIVRIASETRGSPEKAKERFNYLATIATKIIDRKAVFGPDGEKVGERMVAVFRNGASSVVWTNNEKVYTISSASLEHVLEFERQMSPETPMRQDK